MLRQSAITLILFILGLVSSPNFARADACPHAPAPRLTIGETAVVAAGIDHLNLRALPAVDTGIEVVLRTGMELTVLAGPSCNGSYNWWRVELPNGTRGWVAEGSWEQYYVLPSDERERPVKPFQWSCPRFAQRWCRVPW